MHLLSRLIPVPMHETVVAYAPTRFIHARWWQWRDHVWRRRSVTAAL